MKHLHIRSNLRFVFSCVCFFVPYFASAEVLSIRDLRADESVVIAYRSAGCFHYVERFYQVRGGDVPTFGIVEHQTYLRGHANYSGPDRTLAVARIAKMDLIGLDSYVLFLRHGFRGACTTRDFITIGYYRKGRLIGQEQFTDETCLISEFALKADKIVPPVDRPGLDPYPGGFPKEVFAEITPPWLIEKRIVEKSKQPTSTLPAEEGPEAP